MGCDISWPISVMHHLGLPLPRSPLVFFIPKNFHRVMMSHPHPSGEGKGGLESLLGMLVIVPISLNRGEGQTVGWFAA